MDEETGANDSGELAGLKCNKSSLIKTNLKRLTN